MNILRISVWHFGGLKDLNELEALNKRTLRFIF